MNKFEATELRSIMELTRNSRFHHLVVTRTKPWDRRPHTIFHPYEHKELKEAQAFAQELNGRLFKDDREHTTYEGGYEAIFVGKGEEYDAFPLPEDCDEKTNPDSIKTYVHGLNDGTIHNPKFPFERKAVTIN